MSAEGQKRALGPLALELKVPVSLLTWRLGLEVRSSQEQDMVLTIEPFHPAAPFLLLKTHEQLSQ